MTNEQGSVIAVTNSSGAASVLNSYDDYGTPGSNNTGRFQYTGQAWIPEIGMYDYKARIYSPSVGRFLQTDPMGYGDGLNIYAYVHGDPVNGFDPTGTDADTNVGNGSASDDWIVHGTPVVGTDAYFLQSGGLALFGDDLSFLSFYNFGNGGPSSVGRNAGDIVVSAPKNKCFGAPPAPGTGVSTAQLMDQARLNGAQASQQKFNLLWFRDMVRNKAPWDYKQYDRGFQDFGNYNYGYTGTALHISSNFLLQQAGIAQVAAGTSAPDWGKPGFIGLIGGTAPYGDDRHDQEMIMHGISDRRNGC